MTFDSLMLRSVTAAIQARLLGRKIEDIAQPAFDEVWFGFGRRRDSPGLVLSSSPEFGRVHLSQQPPSNPPTPPPFCSALRRHLRGAVLRQARQESFDRIVRLEFDHCEGYGEECRRAFVAEIMGRHANMVLLDDQEIILACAKHVTISVNRYREILPGLRYVAPPAGDRLDPESPAAEQAAAEADAEPGLDLSSWLRHRLMGMSPVLAEEVLWRAARAAGPTQEPSAALALAQMRAVLAAGSDPGAPAWLCWAPGQAPPAPPHLAYPVALISRAADHAEEAPERLSAAVEELVARQRENAGLERVRGHLSAEIRAVQERLRRTREKCEQSLAEAAHGERWKRQGELLLAHAAQLSDGIAEAVVTDYFDATLPQVAIELDPTLSIIQNAERLFEQYKRARRAEESLRPRLASLERNLARLAEAAASAQTADQEELAAIAGSLQRRKLIAAPRKAGAGRKAAERPPYRTTTSRDGVPVFYGRNARENDAVLRAAAPSDWWFHARNRPGGHVIVRSAGEPDQVPRSTLLEAAALAASLTGVGGLDDVEVDYTQRRHVTRRRDAGPGQVTYVNFKTMLVAAPGGRTER